MVGFLIEHYAGRFPVWLAPEQARVIPITSDHNEYGEQVTQKLKDAGVRVSGDYSSDRMNAKIRAAQLMKIPYMLVMGDSEIENGTVALRKQDGSRQNDLPVDEFITMIQERIQTRSRINRKLSYIAASSPAPLWRDSLVASTNTRLDCSCNFFHNNSSISIPVSSCSIRCWHS